MWGNVALAIGQMYADAADRELVDRMREEMTPTQFNEWQKERTDERRHREKCAAIEQAGHNAKPEVTFRW